MREAAGFSPCKTHHFNTLVISVAENAADNLGMQVRFLTGAATTRNYPMSLDGKRVLAPGELNPNGEGADF
jgi:hypothetical protein